MDWSLCFLRFGTISFFLCTFSVYCHQKGDHQQKRSRSSSRAERKQPLSADDDHVKEHYKGVADIDEAEMSPEELEFHFFRQHDLDNNTMLDGLEIYKSLTHFLPYDDNDKEKLAQKDKTLTPGERKQEEEKYYTEIIDSVMDEDDINQDGYLTYAEYVLARRRQEEEFASESVRQKH